MGGHFRSMLTTAKYLNISGMNAYVSLSMDLKKITTMKSRIYFHMQKKLCGLKKVFLCPI